MPEFIEYQTRKGETKKFDISPEALEPFGFQHGESCRHPEYGMGKVIGVSEGKSG